MTKIADSSVLECGIDSKHPGQCAKTFVLWVFLDSWEIKVDFYYYFLFYLKLRLKGRYKTGLFVKRRI